MWRPRGRLPSLAPSQPRPSCRGSLVGGGWSQRPGNPGKVCFAWSFHPPRGCRSECSEARPSQAIVRPQTLYCRMGRGPSPKPSGQSLASSWIPGQEEGQLTDLQSFNSFSWASWCSLWAPSLFSSSLSSEHCGGEKRQHGHVGGVGSQVPVLASQSLLCCLIQPPPTHTHTNAERQDHSCLRDAWGPAAAPSAPCS